MSLLIAAAHGGEGFWSEYLHLTTDAAHIAFEMTYEVLAGLLLYPVARKFWERGRARAIRSHDERHHPDDVHSDL